MKQLVRRQSSRDVVDTPPAPQSGARAELPPTEGFDEPVSPVFDRVPPTIARKHAPGDRALETIIFQLIVPAVLPGGALVGGGNALGLMPGFAALTCRIDNMTNQWLELPTLALFIPPGNVARIVRLNGASSFAMIFRQPPGIAAAAVVGAGQIARLVLSNEDLPENPGFVIPVAVVT